MFKIPIYIKLARILHNLILKGFKVHSYIRNNTKILIVTFITAHDLIQVPKHDYKS
jgi:hypothetical protein